MFADFAAGLLVGHGGAIGPVASDGIIGIGNGEHAGGDVNGLTREAVWIARSVESFMMLTDHKPRRRKEIDVTDDFQTKTYMVLHHQPFFMGQRALLQEYGVSNAYFPNIVEERALLEGGHLVIFQIHLGADSETILHNTV